MAVENWNGLSIPVAMSQGEVSFVQKGTFGKKFLIVMFNPQRKLILAHIKIYLSLNQAKTQLNSAEKNVKMIQSTLIS